MLRSYQYTEPGSIIKSIQNPNIRKKELEIARKYTFSHKGRGGMVKNCPVCGKGKGEYFYTKWEIDYLVCPECKSVYADVDEAIARNYQKYEPLLKLRLSEPYQVEATSSRADMWNDFIEWVGMRAFRFIGKNKNLNIVDTANRFTGYTELIKKNELCGRYELRESILEHTGNIIPDSEADILLYIDQLQKEPKPVTEIRKLYTKLSEGGLLFLGTRAGSGFDILTLREKNENIYPYEHITLPSVKGLTIMLEENGFQVLEITTPGVMDVKYVMDSVEKLDDREGFVKYLLKESDAGILQEFQRFLQKGCLSSFVRVVAQKH